MKTAFVTGANGFVGSHMCDAFLREGYRVYGLVRPTSDIRFLRGSTITMIRGDLTDVKDIAFPDEVDVIVHTAALVDDMAPIDESRRHILGITRNIADEALRRYPRLQRFIYISSVLTLGYCDDNISPEHPGHSALYVPYVRMKKEAEEYLLALHRERGFPVTILRPGDIYGPRDRTSCEIMLRNIEKGVPLRLGTGRKRFALCNPANLCRAALAAATKPGANGKAYTVVNGVAPMWREFFGALQEGVGRPQKVFVPAGLLVVASLFIEILRRVIPGFRPPINFYRIRRTTSQTTFDMRQTLAELGYQSDEDYPDLFKSIVAWYLEDKATRSVARGAEAT